MATPTRSPAATSWASLLARLILGLVFLIAALTKVGQPAISAEAVKAYQILPSHLATLWGAGQPFLELALGVLLIAGLGTRLVAVLAGLLLLAFLGAIASVWARGIFIDCGCFGGGGAIGRAQTHYPLEMMRDAGLLALSTVVAARPYGRLTIDHLLGVAPQPPGPPAEAHRARGTGA